MSYCGHLDFGIVADREQMRDVWKLISWLRDSLTELELAAGLIPPEMTDQPGAQSPGGNGATPAVERSGAERA